MTPSMRRDQGRRVSVGLLTLLAVLAVLPLGAAAAAPVPTPVAPTAPWLTVVNHYRSMAGLAPVVEDPAWSAGATAHSRYLLDNGTIAHDEIDGARSWTPEGDAAGNASNVAVHSSASFTARQHIEQWMSGPFHAIGILRPQLRVTGFGHVTDAGTAPWRSAATLDVGRGVDRSVPIPASPVLFPGNGTTTSLDRLATESPDPKSFCGWSGDAGLPLLALFPTDPGTATASLTGPSGPVALCALTAANTTGVAQSILAGERAAVVLPRTVLAPGRYDVTVATSGAGSVSWSFTVDPSVANGPVTPTTPLPSTVALGPAAGLQPLPPTRLVDTRTRLGAVRLTAGVVTPLVLAGKLGVPADASALSANLTVVAPDQGGYLTAAPCGASMPDVSSLNFSARQVVANAAVLPLSADGRLCVVSTANTDLLIDVSGALRPSGSERYTPLAPARILDTRSGTGGSRRVAPGGRITLVVRNVGGVPANATAVALNVTAVAPDATPNGYVTVYPCGTVPNASNLNLAPGETRPNLVLAPVSADGTVCLMSTVGTDLLADVAGAFASSGGRSFTPLAPIRMFDSRQGDTRLNAGLGGARLTAGGIVRVPLAGVRGVPAGATAVSVNLTVTDAQGTGYLTAFPCGARPDVSNVNFARGTDVANAAQVTLDPQGAVCVYASATTHVLVDVNGVWS